MFGGHHLDAAAAVVITLVLAGLHTRGYRVPVLGDLWDMVLGKQTVATGTPMIDWAQQILDQLKLRIPHPSDVKPAAQLFEVVVGPDGKPSVQPK